jgi:hypothetical protein
MERSSSGIEVHTQSVVKIIKLRGRLCLGESLDRTSATLTDLISTGEAKEVANYYARLLPWPLVHHSLRRLWTRF